MINFTIKNPTDMTVNIELLNCENEIETYKFSVYNPNNSPSQTITVTFSEKSEGAFSIWNCNCTCDRLLKTNWLPSELNSSLYSGAPTQQIIAADGRNIFNIAILDAGLPIDIKTGVIEETAQMLCEIHFFTIPVKPFSQYETQIRIDRRNIAYYRCLNEVKEWWTACGGYCDAYIPDAARMPVNSLWYSFHQNLDVDQIVKQCELSYDLGMRSVIIDDGWETDDTNRGFSFCGDWEVAESKIKGGMKNFVKKVHDTGLKFLMWYSVPFVGKNSKAFERFNGKITNFNGRYGCLDPRYKDVREYLISTYENAVREWDLDGLKLDFIDYFALPKEGEKTVPGRDIESISEAVNILLSEVKKRLCSIKPDFMFEFRQKYIGPVVSQYGTMFRIADCPADSLRNRVGVVDVRLLSAKSPAHSDMLMWSLDDSAENVALQIINIIFAVPQISMLIDKLPKSHYDTLKFYLDFWCKNRNILLDGEFVADNPESNYSFISSEKDNSIIAVAHSKNVMTLSKDYKRIVLINGTAGSNLFIDKEFVKQKYDYKILDCMGKEINHGTIDENTFVHKFYVPLSGMIELLKV